MQAAAAELQSTRSFKDATIARNLRLEHRHSQAQHSPSGYVEISKSLDKTTSQVTKAACMTNQIPPNALIQGAWALMLSIFQETNDVVFGATVAGRPGDLEGIESLVGFFSNSIPMRIQIGNQ